MAGDGPETRRGLAGCPTRPLANVPHNEVKERPHCTPLEGPGGRPTPRPGPSLRTILRTTLRTKGGCHEVPERVPEGPEGAQGVDGMRAPEGAAIPFRAKGEAV